MANPNPSPSTRFQPGGKGGPGRPKGRRLVDELEDLIEEKNARKAIAARWLQEILAGNFKYFAAYIDRRDGRLNEWGSRDQEDDGPARDEHGNDLEP